MSMLLTVLAFVSLAFGVDAQSVPAPAAKALRCNQADGRQIEDAELPSFENDASAIVEVASDDPTLTPDEQRDGRQVRRLNLSRDLTSLAPLTGPAIVNTPVLMLRLENLPGFDPKRHCNHVFPILSKPRIVRLPGDRVRATFDTFSREFDIKAPPAWLHEPTDTTGRIFWIFPARFGHGDKPSTFFALTRSYHANFAKAEPGSLRQAWTAEAYLDLAMRQYWDLAERKRYADLPIPSRADLNRAIFAKSGIDCGEHPEELICLTDRLIETNEVGYNPARLSALAFRTSDSVFARSGLSVGLQQLDVGSGDRQSELLIPEWMPTTVGTHLPYRDIIRLWSIDTLNRWYGTDSSKANADLAKPAIKAEILKSHADLLVTLNGEWRQEVQSAYPAWEPARQSGLALIAMDIQNNTGTNLYLPPDAAAICEVLTSRYVRHYRNERTGKFVEIPANLNYLTGSITRKRMQAGREIAQTVPGYVASEWTCLDENWQPAPEPAAPIVSPAPVSPVASAPPTSSALSASGQAAQEAALSWLITLGPSGKARWDSARYMTVGCKAGAASCCDPPDKNWGSAHPGFEAYQGFPVERCEYSVTREADPAVGRVEATLLAVVWMLNPDAPTLARWIGSACETLGTAKPADCGRLIAGMILQQNGAQYAVAGHVLETQSEAGCAPSDGCPKDLLKYLPFRDGVTVKMATDDRDERRGDSFADFAAADTGAKLTLGALAGAGTKGRVGRIGRIANIERASGLSDEQWLASNRDAYLLAFRIGAYLPLADSGRAFCRQTNAKGELVRDCGF